MGRVLALLAMLGAPLLAIGAVPAQARVTVVEETWEYEAEPASGTAGRFVSGVPLESVPGLATYGPFRVVDSATAALVGITDERSPAQFAAMLRDFPALATIEMIECPGTFDDRANLELGRMIRAAGLATHVPADGSVRSGAVELFFAGAVRRIDEGARFAVHAWEDEDGLEATDFAADAPENRKYLRYYREMGFDDARARAFYELTNSVSFDQALWLDAEDMRAWLPEARVAAAPRSDPQPEPRLAYLDLAALLN